MDWRANWRSILFVVVAIVIVLGAAFWSLRPTPAPVEEYKEPVITDERFIVDSPTSTPSKATTTPKKKYPDVKPPSKVIPGSSDEDPKWNADDYNRG